MDEHKMLSHDSILIIMYIRKSQKSILIKISSTLLIFDFKSVCLFLPI